ncbi:ATP-binding protein [Rubellimicrobium sp. CFH 75288]|uniref:ATP-binding protein n=1 Tax=Rubellimicrobium sp. CFH 75288 TaxID=2697034 RepID=UPI0014128A94|nr:ATP-binding protein [Rubellimicrobium sp. CFH 75288]NAZ37050.1 GAF domain-containing protein [Rubellimicrobium sp. CFH 75288]
MTTAIEGAAAPQRGWTVRRNLFVYTLLFSLPILLLLGLALWSYGEAERRNLENSARDAAQRIAYAAEREVGALLATVDVLAASPYLRSGDLVSFHAEARDLLERRGIVTVLRTPDGQQVVNPRRPFGDPLPVTILEEDAEALRTGAAVVTNLFTGSVSGDSIFAAVTPIFEDSEPRWLLSVNYSERRLQGIVDAAQLPVAWTGAIVDRAGTIMARNRDPERFVGTRATQDLIDATTGEGGTWLGFTADGQRVFGAYARIPSAGWRVAVGVRRADLASPVRRSVGILAGLGAGLLLLSASLGLIAERRIAAPVRALQRQAEALGRRDVGPPLATGLREVDDVSRALADATADLREKNRTLDILNRAGTTLAQEIEPDRVAQVVIEEASRLVGAAYGAFFERVVDDRGEEAWRLFALTGAPKEAFTRFGMPRATTLFTPTFQGHGVIRSDDVLHDPRYGSHGGLPEGHLPVRSYLAIPVVSGKGQILGALLFGHPVPGRFGLREERLIGGFAGQAAIALGRAHLFQAAQQEIENRRAAEAALEQASRDAQARAAETAAILGQLAEGVIVTDPDGRIVFVNEAAARLHGVAKLDIAPEDYTRSYSLLTMEGEPHPVEDLPLYRAVRHAETVNDARWRIRRPDGTELVVVGGARPVFGPDGARLGSVLTLRDDTARHRSEAELQRLNTILSEQAAELAESNDELQRYAYIVSHDLRSPLVNVMGFTSELRSLRDELLEAGARPAGDPERQRTIEEFDEALRFIQAATTKMEGLIAAILKLSREGRRRLEAERVDMSALIGDLAAAMQHQVEEAEATLEIVEPLPDLVADRLALSQIFGNLLDNAVKYLDPARPGHIRIDGAKSGGKIVYRVSDNGRGIDPKDHGRVFELFRRAGTQDRPGEGIGLAHVRTLVRAMGGRIELDSAPGKGTTFIVTLPAVALAARPAAE